MEQLLDDLRAEGDSLDDLLAPLPPNTWATPTPAVGWTIAHQIGHLAWTDRVAALTTGAAAGDREAAAGFDAEVRNLLALTSNPVDAVLVGIEAEPVDQLLARWRGGREQLLALLPVVTGKINWFGPPMSAASMATARIMETWAHGCDVADALGVRREPTHRLRHIAHLGVRTRDFAFVSLGDQAPTTACRVDLTAPDGSTWSWGPADAPDRVTGSALDFCLLVTQRAHRDDLDVVANGRDADRWLDIARAFAGPPGQGRPPGSRTTGLTA